MGSIMKFWMAVDLSLVNFRVHMLLWRVDQQQTSDESSVQ